LHNRCHMTGPEPSNKHRLPEQAYHLNHKSLGRTAWQSCMYSQDNALPGCRSPWRCDTRPCISPIQCSACKNRSMILSSYRGYANSHSLLSLFFKRATATTLFVGKLSNDCMVFNREPLGHPQYIARNAAVTSSGVLGRHDLVSSQPI